MSDNPEDLRVVGGPMAIKGIIDKMNLNNALMRLNRLADDTAPEFNVETIAPVVRQVLAGASTELTGNLGLDASLSDQEVTVRLLQGMAYAAGDERDILDQSIRDHVAGKHAPSMGI